MRNIVERLQEQRQVEVAKSIVENAGYKVSEKLKDAYDEDSESDQNLFDAISTMLADRFGFDDLNPKQEQEFMKAVEILVGIKNTSMKESKSTGALGAKVGSTIIDTKTGKEGVVKKTGQSGNYDLLYVDFGNGKLRKINPMDDAQTTGRYELKESKSPRAVSLRSRKAK